MIINRAFRRHLVVAAILAFGLAGLGSTSAMAFYSAGTIDEGGFGRTCTGSGGGIIDDGARFGCYWNTGDFISCWRIIDGSGSHTGVCWGGSVYERVKTGAKGPLSPPATLTSPLGGTTVVGDRGSSGLGGTDNSGAHANASGLKASVGASSSNPGGNGGKHAIGLGN